MKYEAHRRTTGKEKYMCISECFWRLPGRHRESVWIVFDAAVDYFIYLFIFLIINNKGKEQLNVAPLCLW